MSTSLPPRRGGLLRPAPNPATGAKSRPRNPPPREPQGRGHQSDEVRRRLLTQLRTTQAALQAADLETANRPPLRRGRGRWLWRGGVLLLVLVGAWSLQRGGAPATPTRAPHPAAASRAAGSTTPSARPTSTNTAGATAAATGGPPPAAVATPFLAAYFSWTAADSDQTYVTRWQAWVAPTAVAPLLSDSPFHLLDAGNDSQAQSPPPSLAPARPPGTNRARLSALWTLQVLPPGGELVQWQRRQVQASVILTWQDGAWQITAVTWQSQAQ